MTEPANNNVIEAQHSTTSTTAGGEVPGSRHRSIYCSFTLKNAGLKTTQLGLFGNPALGKYWTEHMLGYFDSAGQEHPWTKYKTNLIYLGEYSIVYNITYI